MTDVVPAAIYTRISHDPDGAKLGVSRQQHDCESFCSQRGWEVHKIYEDDDISAYSGKNRPAYRELLEDIRAGLIRAVVAWHPDRLHRHPRELEEFIDVCERAGVRVETVQAGTIDLSTPSGRAVARTLGAWARFESEHKAERQRRKHLELALAGRDAGGTRPFGYEEDRHTIRPNEATLIEEAAQRVLTGEGLRTVCRDWTTRGILSATGKSWSAVALRNILLSARISGRREYFTVNGRRVRIGRIMAPAVWDGIITIDESDRLRALLSDPRRQQSGGLARSYLLTGGIARCGRCGHPLWSGATNGNRSLRCLRRDSGEGCGRVSIMAEPVEHLVVEAVFQRIEAGALETIMTQSDDHTIADELLTVETSLAALARDWAEERITRVEWDAARETLAGRQQALARQVQAHRRAYAFHDLPDPLREAWPTLPLHKRRAVMGALVDAVIINPAILRGRKYFDDRRIDVRWKA
jgi:site-specific DNA recombinase